MLVGIGKVDALAPLGPLDLAENLDPLTLELLLPRLDLIRRLYRETEVGSERDVRVGRQAMAGDEACFAEGDVGGGFTTLEEEKGGRVTKGEGGYSGGVEMRGEAEGVLVPSDRGGQRAGICVEVSVARSQSCSDDLHKQSSRMWVKRGSEVCGGGQRAVRR